MEYTRFERIRMACEELGTTFIKFAQIASNRPDILPEPLIEELTKLQDHAPVVPEKHIRHVLDTEFGKPIEELLEAVNYEPIASASIAQVHRARLIGGKEVVLKVQRPNVAKDIEADIQILKTIARTVEQYFPQYAAFQPMELVKMFEKSIRKELKFTTEASSLRRFHRQFKGNPDIYIPTYYQELSTDKVLCMEYIDGYKITDKSAWNIAGTNGKELAKKGINLYFRQVFEHGFFHADPHPGNIFLMQDGRICFIDYGMMGTIIDSDKKMLAELLLSMHNQDVEGLKRSLIKFAGDAEVANLNELEYDIIDFFADYTDRTIDEIEGEEFIAALNCLFFDYNIRIPPNLLLLLKAFVIIEGVGLMLDPSYNIIKNIEPFASKLIAQQYNPKKLGQNMLKSLNELTELSTTIPDDTRTIIKKLKEGKLHIEFEHVGLEQLYKKMEITSTRISFTLVTVALILGSSLLVIADVPPHVGNIPVLGFAGFIASGFLGIRLLISFIKHGNF